MGFLNFGKKQQSTPTKPTPTKPITPKTTVTETVPVSKAPVVHPEPEEIHKPKHEPKAIVVPDIKDDVADFFSVDIYTIFEHEPKPAGNGKGTFGNPVEIFTLQLPKPQLSTFQSLKILRYQNGHYDLVFTSDSNEINNDLREFIDFCGTFFGPDFMKKGSVNDNDLRDATLGAFSRIWYESVRLENPSFKFTLTLYDITPK